MLLLVLVLVVVLVLVLVLGQAGFSFSCRGCTVLLFVDRPQVTRF